jgi:hypothetical protein
MCAMYMSISIFPLVTSVLDLRGPVAFWSVRLRFMGRRFAGRGQDLNGYLEFPRCVYMTIYCFGF